MSLKQIATALVVNTKQFQQEKRSSIQNLETRMSKLATTVGKLESRDSGKLPPQSIINPKQNVNAVTLRSGKQLKELVKLIPNNVVEEEIEKEDDGSRCWNFLWAVIDCVGFIHGFKIGLKSTIRDIRPCRAIFLIMGILMGGSII